MKQQREKLLQSLKLTDRQIRKTLKFVGDELGVSLSLTISQTGTLCVTLQGSSGLPTHMSLADRPTKLELARFIAAIRAGYRHGAAEERLMFKGKMYRLAREFSQLVGLNIGGI